MAAEAPEELGLVVVDDRALRWAVPADDVRGIVQAAVWRGERPLDVAGLWRAWLAGAVPVAVDSPPGARALVVRTKLGERAFLSPGVSFRLMERSRVLSLPDVLARGRGASMVAGIVFGGPEEQLIVLNPDGFVGPDMSAADGAAPATASTFGRGKSG